MFAQFVEKLRKNHNLTQERVASELDISRPTYIQFERGQRDLTISEARKLSALFNMQLDDLLNERETTIALEIKKGKSVAKNKKSEVRISIPQQKIDKFRQILFYILKKVGGKPSVGMTVIYKLLYFIDFDYYEKYEERLMGLKYIKNHFGPTPVIFEKIIQEMVKNGEVEVIKSKFYQHEQKKYFLNPLLEPNLSVLNGQEMEHIEWELLRLSDLNAASLSDLSHRDVPWISTKLGMPIEYESVFYRTVDTSVRNYEYTKDN
ncbi:MAG: type II toxin-antitoxin system antitoxin SocA domain-containing protein [bacterium]